MTQRTVESIEPPDCYLRARQLAADIELIRKEMGRPTDTRLAAIIRGASPREVWFQALAVFRKADRMCHEIANDPTAGVPHAPPISEIKPGHVLAVIDSTMREVAETKHALGISEPTEDIARDASKTPSDVFAALAAVNRQINVLLERPFTPADVFQQVSFAVAYTARLGGGSLPAESALVRYKRPTDVYQRLQHCLELARTLVAKAGHPVIENAVQPGSGLGPPVRRLRHRLARARRGGVPPRAHAGPQSAVSVRGQHARTQAAGALLAARRRARAPARTARALSRAPRAQCWRTVRCSPSWSSIAWVSRTALVRPS